MKQRGISRAQAAKTLGCATRMIDLWQYGQVIPGLVYAFAIEMWTEGGVSVDSWLGTSLGRFTWEEFKRNSNMQGGAQDGQATTDQ